MWFVSIKTLPTGSRSFGLCGRAPDTASPKQTPPENNATNTEDPTSTSDVRAHATPKSNRAAASTLNHQGLTHDSIDLEQTTGRKTRA